MAKKETPLTARQAAFVQEYLVDLNGTQAAIRAGYAPKSAGVHAARLLANAKIQESVATGMRARAERVQVSADDVLRELLRIARADIGQAFDDNGALKRLKDMPEDVRRAIAGVDVEQLTEDGVAVGVKVRARFWDKTKALELLAKHLGLLTDKMQVTGKDGGPVAADVTARVTHTGPSENHLANTLAVLARVGALPAASGEGSAGPLPDAPADALHPPPAAPDAGGIPPAE